MDEAGPRDWVERTVRQRVGVGYTVTGGSIWLIVKPDGAVLPEHGWKLHVSSRASNFPALVETLLPLLVAEGCVFKLARSQQVLHELNDGQTAAASVGKAFTVYPDQQQVRELGLRLAQELRGHQGPRVLSDRRVSANAPVYYRYGPFAIRRSRDARRRTEIRLNGPDGDEFEARAGLRYRQPSWATDPFTGRIEQPEPGRDRDDVLLGGRYDIVMGIREAALGNVYRAIDKRDDQPVVIKQARALVAEHGDGNDTRLRLRNERRILQALDGLAGVPRFIDHFRHGADEFLVTSDCGPRTLDQDVRQNGRYQPGGTDARSLDRLAADLARILGAVHERGVIMRDLSPANVVVGNGVSIIDFGLAARDGLHLPGKTPGYAPARQVRDEPPRDTDDVHALGMTLLYAATGLHPVTLGQDPELARTRALQAVSRDCGQRPSGIMSAITDLLSGDDERARTTARQIASGNSSWSASPLPLSAPAAITEELAVEVTDNLVRDLVSQLDDLLEAPDYTQTAHDASVYSGAAGIGLELLHHDAYPSAAERAGRLAAFTVRALRQTKLPPGLYDGATGADLFLHEVVDRGISVTDWPGRSLPPPEWEPETSDLIDGSAGVGLAHLYFYRGGGDPADLEVARRCARAVSATRPLGPRPAPDKADLKAGRAHGLAGEVALLLGLAEETGEALVLETAADRVRRLAERTRPLLAGAKDPAAEPMTASWCRGLSGIGQSFLHAGTVLGDASVADFARQAADACIVRTPRLSELGQCCGVAGVGNYLLDLAIQDRSERYWEAARDVATHLLLRSAGPAAHPRFFELRSPPDRALSWARGLAGILRFFRRLARGEADRVLPLR